MADVSSTPDLRDPLGAPTIIKGTEYMDALARMGYNMETMTSPMPLIASIAKAGTSMLDQVYQQNLDYQKAQNELAYKTAQTKEIDSITDFNNKSLDVRIRGLDAEAKQRELTNLYDERTLDNRVAALDTATKKAQDDADYEKQLHPKLLKAQDIANQGNQGDLDLKDQQIKDAQAAMTKWNQVYGDYPQPFDAQGNLNPNYIQQKNDWQNKNRDVITNPATAARAAKMIADTDGLFNSSAQKQVEDSQIGTIIQGQKDNLISPMINPQALSPDQRVDYGIRANLGRLSQTLQNGLSMLDTIPATPENQAQLAGLRQRLTAYKQEADTISHTDNDPEVQNIKKSGMLSHYTPTGEMNGDIAADINRLKSYLEMTGQADKAAKVTFKSPAKVGGKEVPVTEVTGTPQQVEQMRRSGYFTNFGVTMPGMPTIAPEEKQRRQAIVNQTGLLSTPEAKDPNVQQQVQSFLNGQIDQNQLIKNLRDINAAKTAAPEAKQAPKAAEGLPPNKPADQSVPRIPSANYQYPNGAPDTAGIDRNIWQEILSREGPQFSPDHDEAGNVHPSVFGLWKDAKTGPERDAYQIAERFGPTSLQTYNAVTNLWSKWAHESGADPWKLQSPGLQMLVLSDVQHRGGAKEVGDALHELGTTEQINAMDPIQAITRYTNIRRRFWRSTPGGDARVSAEGNYALDHDRELRGATGTAQAYQSGGLVTPAAQDTDQQTEDVVTAALMAGQPPQGYQEGGMVSASLGLPLAMPQLASLPVARRAQPVSQPVQPQPQQPLSWADRQSATQGETETAQESNYTTLSPKLTGLATNFGHDVNGRPDTYMLSQLGAGSRIGAFGTDVVNPTTSGVSLPAKTIATYIGNPTDHRVRQQIAQGRYKVRVSAPNGTEETFPIVDIGPGPNEPGAIDMTGTALRKLGQSGNFNANFQIVDTGAQSYQEGGLVEQLEPPNPAWPKYLQREMSESRPTKSGPLLGGSLSGAAVPTTPGQQHYQQGGVVLPPESQWMDMYGNAGYPYTHPPMSAPPTGSTQPFWEGTLTSGKLVRAQTPAVMDTGAEGTDYEGGYISSYPHSTQDPMPIGPPRVTTPANRPHTEVPYQYYDIPHSERPGAGGYYPGILHTSARPGSTDTVPAMLSPGEYVMNQDAVNRVGLHNLEALNRGYAVPGQQSTTTEPTTGGRHWGNNG